MQNMFRINIHKWDVFFRCSSSYNKHTLTCHASELINIFKPQNFTTTR